MRVAKQKLLEQTVRLMGAEALARKLGVQHKVLEAWMRGDVTMPDGELLRLSAILDEFGRSKK